MNTESLDGTLLLKWHLYNLNKSWLGEISLHSVRNHPRAVYEAAVDSDGQRNGPRRLSGRTSSRWQFNTKSKIRISHCAIHQSGQLWFELQRFGAIGRGDVRLFSSLMFVEVEQNKRSARFQKKKKRKIWKLNSLISFQKTWPSCTDLVVRSSSRSYFLSAKRNTTQKETNSWKRGSCLWQGAM